LEGDCGYGDISKKLHTPGEKTIGTSSPIASSYANSRSQQDLGPVPVTAVMIASGCLIDEKSSNAQSVVLQSAEGVNRVSKGVVNDGPVSILGVVVVLPLDEAVGDGAIESPH
jgi:hypothetical protein